MFSEKLYFPEISRNLKLIKFKILNYLIFNIVVKLYFIFSKF